MADVREAKIDELVPDRKNANKGTQAGLRALDKSLRDFGAGRSILIDKDGEIIAGNKTTERAADLGIDDVIIVPTDGTKLVAVQRTDLDLDTDPEARQLAYADNRIAEIDLEWDYEQVDFDLEQGVDLEWLGFDLEQEPRDENRGVLNERFIIPPFTILDTRQGYWLDRKRAWLDLGIEPELGRIANAMGDSMHFKGSTQARRTNITAGLSPSMFDPVLCEVAYRWFCPPGGSIINPTAGESVYGIVAGYLGYPYKGVELRLEQIISNR